MFKYSKISLTKIKKIREISNYGQEESAGPIFGCILGPEEGNGIYIYNLYNKTSSSSIASAEFNFKNVPWMIRRFNKKQKKIGGRQIKYIGSWHTHPSFELTPSPKDEETMDKIFDQLCIYKNAYMILNSKGILEMEKTRDEIKKVVYKWS